MGSQSPGSHGTVAPGETVSRAEERSGATGEEAGVARRVDSSTLLGRQREVVIVHRGQEYRLRVTKSDKLILTK